MPKIYIDNVEYEVPGKKNLLEACLSLGFNLPYFCWHPAMGSVGACRQCAIKKFKDENDKQGKIVMACMEPVEEGVRISLKDPEASEFRANIIQWLMTNHPHDCPICDEGGQCHLQDMTVMTGHNYRTFRFKKRTHNNQNLGPFLNHEMNRCIQCYRCVRFYREYAGGRDFNVFAAHNHVYFGRYEDGTLESEFSGNLVEVCPTGVFTDKSLKKHYTRKWDLTQAPSICHHCGLGCNIIPGERYGSLRQVIARYNGKVNQYFLCDRGRYGYEFVNSKKRIKSALLKKSGNKFENVEKDILLSELSKFMANRNMFGIGSPRATLEANHAVRTLVGEDNFYQGVSSRQQNLMNDILDVIQNGPCRTPSLAEIEQTDAILILGEDITNSAPMMDLAVRQALRQSPMSIVERLNIPEWQDAAVLEAIQDRKSPLYIVTPHTTKLDEHAKEVFRLNPADISRLGFAIANTINSKAPAVPDLDKDIKSRLGGIVNDLKDAKKPLIISGTTLQSEAVLQAAANIARALHFHNNRTEISFVVPACNSIGTAMMDGKNMEDLMAQEKIDKDAVLIILENDLFRQMEKKQVEYFLKKWKTIICLDYYEHDTTSMATVVIPAGAFSETDGTLVNNEGRAQRFYQVYPPIGNIQESWRWISDIMAATGHKETKNLQNLNDFIRSVAESYPEFRSIVDITPPPGFRIAGQKIPREPHRFSGRTAMNANINVSEPKPPLDPDSALSFTMEGFQGKPPSPLIPFFWSPGWNSQQAINKYQIEVGGPLQGGDPGKRLLENGGASNGSYFKDIPEQFKSKKDGWLLIPLALIYGSEELSSLSAPIQQRIPDPFAIMNNKDADQLKIKEGKTITLNIDDSHYKCKVVIEEQFPQGTIGLPVNLPALSGIQFPEWAKISGESK